MRYLLSAATASADLINSAGPGDQGPGRAPTEPPWPWPDPSLGQLRG
jgi:hypothetical protein